MGHRVLSKMRLMSQSGTPAGDSRLGDGAPASCSSHAGRIPGTLSDSADNRAVRLRILFATFIPTLLLLGSGRLPLDPSPSYSSRPVSDCVGCARESAEHRPFRDCPSINQSTRSKNRRVVKQCGSDGFPPAAVSAGGFPADLAAPPLSSISSEGPPGLAQYWQFSWRTALEPRAPSLVS
jgi:hypothetical protein